ncbi:MAG: plasma-membrane proton-efflux P-type ATPase [Thermofilaceae archaeon]
MAEQKHFIDFRAATKEETLRELQVDPAHGLSVEEVQRRLELYGFNEVPKPKANPILAFLKKFWGLTPWMLEAVVLLSLILHKYLNASIVGGLLIFNALMSFWQEQKASRAVEALRERLQINARVLRGGQWTLLPARELVPGDIVRLRAGDFVPADVKLLAGGIEADQSALTGESLTVSLGVSDLVFCGSIVRRGEGEGVVVLTGVRTYFGRTVELVQVAHPKSHAEEVTAQVAQWLLILVGTVLGATIMAALAFNISLLEMLPLALILLASSVPVALPTMFTISMSLGALELAHKGVLVTKLSAVADAATMDTLCVDKTGTLTQNRLTLVEVHPLPGYSAEEVLRWAALASQEADQDPIDLAILHGAATQNVDLRPFQRVEFIPFDPSKRRTEAIIEQNGQRFLVMKGAVETVADLAHVDPALWQEQLSLYASKGYRTLAVAVGKEGEPPCLAGLIALYDPPRSDALSLIKELQGLGLSVKMLTGDAQPIASEIARQIGIGEKVLSATELREQWQSDPLKAASLVEESHGIAEVYPEDKYMIVRGLQLRKHRVGMTGDGVNDAPALRQAEVGIAVSNATDVAKSAASAVLTAAGLINIVDLVRIGRMIHQRVLTWICNKIIKTFQMVFFVVIALFITKRFVVSEFEVILLLFFIDFVIIALATDQVRGSRRPSFWNMREIVKISAILGAAVVGESLLLLGLGLRRVGDFDTLRSYSFAILFYMELFTVFVVRERGRFWLSKPSWFLLAIALADLVVVTVILILGIPGLLLPLPIPVLLELIGLTAVFSLVVNDWIKSHLFKKSVSFS